MLNFEAYIVYSCKNASELKVGSECLFIDDPEDIYDEWMPQLSISKLKGIREGKTDCFIDEQNNFWPFACLLEDTDL